MKSAWTPASKLPNVGTTVKVQVMANTDGTFTATKVGNVDAANTDTNQAQYTGTWASAFGNFSGGSIQSTSVPGSSAVSASVTAGSSS